MRGRTIILISHHITLCAPGAGYIVALDNGRVQFHGPREEFFHSAVVTDLMQSGAPNHANEEYAIGDVSVASLEEQNMSGMPSRELGEPKKEKNPMRNLVEEQRAVGSVSHDVWEAYLWACGGGRYWAIFVVILVLAALSPVAETKWVE